MFPPQMPAVKVLAHELQVTKLAVDNDVLVYLLVSGQFALFFVTLSALVTNEVAIFGVNNLVVSQLTWLCKGFSTLLTVERSHYNLFIWFDAQLWMLEQVDLQRACQVELF